MKSIRRRAVGVLLAGLSFGACAGGEVYELVSRNPVSGTLINGNRTSFPSVSADGRYVVFLSSEGGIVTPTAVPAGGGSLATQVFLFDRKLNKTELISVDGSGNPASASTATPTISADGCKVAFSTAAPLVASDLNGGENIYLRDRCASPAVTRMIGESIAVGGYLQHRWPDISADGRFVAFEDSDNAYLHEVATNITTTISVDATGAKAGGRYPAVNSDGSRVAFWSYGSKLVGNDTNGFWDVFLWDRNANPRISRVSTRSDGTERQTETGVSSTFAPAISPSGRYVVFPSRSKDLIPGMGDLTIHQLYAKDTTTNQTHLVSASSSGVPGNADSLINNGRAAVNDDGWVLFPTYAKNLVSDAVAYTYLALHNVQTGRTVALAQDSTSSGPSDRPVMSSDGRYVVTPHGRQLDSRFASSGIFLHDRWASCVFDSLEAKYPTLLPPPASGAAVIGASTPSFIARWYGGGRAYVGVSVTDDHLYYVSVTQPLMDLGSVGNWVSGKGTQASGLPQFSCPN